MAVATAPETPLPFEMPGPFFPSDLTARHCVACCAESIGGHGPRMGPRAATALAGTDDPACVPASPDSPRMSCLSPCYRPPSILPTGHGVTGRLLNDGPLHAYLHASRDTRTVEDEQSGLLQSALHYPPSSRTLSRASPSQPTTRTLETSKPRISTSATWSTSWPSHASAAHSSSYRTAPTVAKLMTCRQSRVAATVASHISLPASKLAALIVIRGSERLEKVVALEVASSPSPRRRAS
ncbi:hypothetical protein BST61_g6995 [Cercospora zeina]